MPHWLMCLIDYISMVVGRYTSRTPRVPSPRAVRSTNLDCCLWDNMDTNVFAWACPSKIFTFLLCFEFFSMICILRILFNLHIALWTGGEPSWLNLFRKCLLPTTLINCVISSIQIMLPSSMPTCCRQCQKLLISHQPTFKIGGSDTSWPSHHPRVVDALDSSARRPLGNSWSCWVTINEPPNPAPQLILLQSKQKCDNYHWPSYKNMASAHWTIYKMVARRALHRAAGIVWEHGIFGISLLRVHHKLSQVDHFPWYYLR